MEEAYPPLHDQEPDGHAPQLQVGGGDGGLAVGGQDAVEELFCYIYYTILEIITKKIFLSKEQ